MKMSNKKEVMLHIIFNVTESKTFQRKIDVHVVVISILAQAVWCPCTGYTKVGKLQSHC